MKIAIGCDPNAAELKNILKGFLEEQGQEVQDLGDEDPIYANTAIDVAEKVAAGKYDRGLLLCGTGLGVSLAANKVKGAYATVCSDPYSVERSIKSNNANILCLGSQVIGVELAKSLLRVWLSNTYEPGGRSQAKIQRIYDYESCESK